MATSMQLIAKFVCRLSPSVSHPCRQLQSRLQRLPVRTYLPPVSPFVHPRHCFCKAASPLDQAARYKDRPWDYPKSEEYLEKYGSSPVWAGYRRNHKGGIPSQKTRRTCIRGENICGNPCPICRDPNLIIHHERPCCNVHVELSGSSLNGDAVLQKNRLNVNLLQQFICPHTGVVYDSSQTGVCLKQQKKLNEAVITARDQGLLSFQIPHVDFSGDYSNSHDAVGCTPPAPSLTSDEPWYRWYGEITPDENEVAKVKKTYKAYLKR